MSVGSAELLADPKPKPIGFSAWATFGLTILLFIIPQIFAGIGLGIYTTVGGDFESKNIIHYFMLDAIVEIATVGFLIWILNLHKLKIKSLIGSLKKKWHLSLPIPIFFAYIATVTIAFTIVQNLLPAVNLDQEQENSFKAAASNPEIILAFIALVVITPIVEELVFRGFLYNGLKKGIGKWGAAIVASFVFALAHGQLNVGIDTFILSMYLILLIEITGSLIPSILLHSFKNLFAFILIFQGRF